MRNNINAIRNRKNKLFNRKFMLLLDEKLLNEATDVAISNDVSVCAFIRESIKRNIKQYQRAAP